MRANPPGVVEIRVQIPREQTVGVHGGRVAVIPVADVRVTAVTDPDTVLGLGAGEPVGAGDDGADAHARRVGLRPGFDVPAQFARFDCAPVRRGPCDFEEPVMAGRHALATVKDRADGHHTRLWAVLPSGDGRGYAVFGGDARRGFFGALTGLVCFGLAAWRAVEGEVNGEHDGCSFRETTPRPGVGAGRGNYS